MTNLYRIFMYIVIKMVLLLFNSYVDQALYGFVNDIEKKKKLKHEIYFACIFKNCHAMFSVSLVLFLQ